MRRYDCLTVLAPMIDDELVVGNVARTSFEWHAVKPRQGNLYTMGMGLVTPVCFGLALTLPHRRVVALDGDGSLLLNLGVLATIANLAPRNLTIFVFDNEAYASTGGLPTATAGKTDLAKIAQGAGIGNAGERQRRGKDGKADQFLEHVPLLLLRRFCGGEPA